MDKQKLRGKAYWEHFPHQADMGIRGIGPTMAEAFAQAAVAMTAVITDPRNVLPREKITVTASDPDPELLFVDFLNAVIFEMAKQHMLFSQFQVTLEDGRLTAMARGEGISLSGKWF